MTSISAATNSSVLVPQTPAPNASTAQAVDGDYKTKGVGHEVKDADGDYKPTKASSGAPTSSAATSSSAVQAALTSLTKGG